MNCRNNRPTQSSEPHQYWCDHCQTYHWVGGRLTEDAHYFYTVTGDIYVSPTNAITFSGFYAKNVNEALKLLPKQRKAYAIAS